MRSDRVFDLPKISKLEKASEPPSTRHSTARGAVAQPLPPPRCFVAFFWLKFYRTPPMRTGAVSTSYYILEIRTSSRSQMKYQIRDPLFYFLLRLSGRLRRRWPSPPPVAAEETIRRLRASRRPSAGLAHVVFASHNESYNSNSSVG
jgi:hypothetical protein